jgi:hypothetical protein
MSHFCSVAAEHVFSHPCIVIRRQCQVHHDSKWYHMTPFSLFQTLYYFHRHQVTYLLISVFNSFKATFISHRVWLHCGKGWAVPSWSKACRWLQKPSSVKPRPSHGNYGHCSSAAQSFVPWFYIPEKSTAILRLRKSPSIYCWKGSLNSVSIHSLLLSVCFPVWGLLWLVRFTRPVWWKLFRFVAALFLYHFS